MNLPEQFKIKPNGFKEVKRTMILRAIPIILIALIGGLAITMLNESGQERIAIKYAILIPFSLVAMGYGVFHSINRQKLIFDSYRLTLDNEVIVREQHQTSTISIRISDIKEIIKNSNGSITIRGNSSSDIIGIPSQIENSEHLEELLAGMGTISIKSSQPNIQIYSIIISIFTIGLMMAVYTSEDKTIVRVGGAALLIILGYSFFEIQRSKNIDQRIKRLSWLVILVSVSIIGTLYYKLVA